ncbi:Hypothetical protein POVR2_LOCUS183 [uncultured virus]|nr:Hypothetical protein POVR2_LOCUS183 [uncultured virus]
MDNPDVLREIALLLDFDTIVRLGRDTEHTRGVSRLLRDATLWKEKTEILVNAELSTKEVLPNRPGTNWIRTYQLVLQFIEDVEEDKRIRAALVPGVPTGLVAHSIANEIYASGLVDVTTLEIFFKLHPPVDIPGTNVKLPSINLKSLDVFLWLLDNKYITLQTDIRYVLESTARTDAVEIARYIVSSLSVTEETQRELMSMSIRFRSTRVFSFLIDRFPKAAQPEKLLELTMKYNRLAMLKIVLDKYIDRLTKQELEGALFYLESFATVPHVVEMIELIEDELSY